MEIKMNSHRTTRLVTIGGAVAGAVTLGIAGLLVGGALAAGASSSDGGLHSREYPTNASGLTYGSDFGAAQEPDLVLVIGDQGREGYVYSVELYPPAPPSPREALATQTPADEIEAVLKVYLSDGLTQIDTFTIYGADRVLE